ncbi:recombinase family protein [Enterococcus faecalis]|nr:recombinase family protein [Enterococcus faecalis]EGO9190558.1 recombinase family protein [Enterococcus faecalis]
MAHIFGYARVSTQSQELERQTDILKRYNCDIIYTEKVSGMKTTRRELTKLKRNTKPGDTVIIESWSRLGRSTKDLIELVEFFQAKNVKIVSDKEKLDTNTPQGKLMLTVFQAFSEFERDLIVQRTNEGLRSARERGRIGGRPKTDPTILKKALRLHTEGLPVAHIAKTLSISKATIYREINRQKEKLPTIE